MSQLLTGHGHFQDRLGRIASCEDGLEARDHVRGHCNLYSAERAVLFAGSNGSSIEPVYQSVLLSSAHKYVCLLAWYGKRKELEKK